MKLVHRIAAAIFAILLATLPAQANVSASKRGRETAGNHPAG